MIGFLACTHITLLIDTTNKNDHSSQRNHLVDESQINSIHLMYDSYKTSETVAGILQLSDPKCKIYVKAYSLN